MKKLAMLLAIIAMAGCSGDSSLPTASGKGTVRALNAIQGSPSTAFRIEEILVENLTYKEGSGGRRWDDFEYIFNFEVPILGQLEAERVASVTQKVDVGQDYTFVTTGAWDAPTVLVWVAPERDWDGSEAVFEMRFAHLAEGTNAVDVYFAADGIPPALGQEQGTLNFGEILPALEFAGGSYVITYTTAGMPGDILYQSIVVPYQDGSTSLAPLFNGDENDTSPYIVSLTNALGGSAPLIDSRSSSTVRLFQGDISMGPTDVYDDEMLNSQILTNHLHGDITGDIDVITGTTSLTYTDVGNPGATQLATGLAAAPGTHYNLVAINTEVDRVGSTYVPDRRSVSSVVRMSVYHAAFNNENLDFYVVDRGTSVDDALLKSGELTYSLLTSGFAFDTGSYDLYATIRDEKTVVAGPVPVDVTIGDVLEMILLDVVDPTMAEIRIAPNQ